MNFENVRCAFYAKHFLQNGLDKMITNLLCFALENGIDPTTSFFYQDHCADESDSRPGLSLLNENLSNIDAIFTFQHALFKDPVQFEGYRQFIFEKNIYLITLDSKGKSTNIFQI
ncbi:hypothetical protein [Brevibacillus sp. FSL L8-0710]|uniref:hypothetical protein n=1 Tax=Brevibacillus sp. FSL L8-0710 TaxID=2975313 RepID=UPI0030F861AF